MIATLTAAAALAVSLARLYGVTAPWFQALAHGLVAGAYVAWRYEGGRFLNRGGGDDPTRLTNRLLFLAAWVGPTAVEAFCFAVDRGLF